MRLSLRQSHPTVVLFALPLLLSSCVFGSDDATQEQGTGGGTASGGDSASGGQTETGGSTAAGGMLGGGGTTNSGGATATGGAASGVGGALGTGGIVDSGWSPCPTEGPCKILPLGDSITDGFGTPGGYRIELFRLSLNDGHALTFVGDKENGPEMVDGIPFPRSHEGVSGETVEQIAARIPDPGLNEPPHIVLLHAGTNDMWGPPEGAETRLGALIDELIAEAPDALIIVSNIIPWPDMSAKVASYNSALVGVVQERIDAGAHVIFVDQFEGFPEEQLADGIHPNEAGYATMAGKWYEAIESYLN